MLGKLVAVLAATGASGCGFQPLYAPSGAGIGKVAFAPIDGRLGFLVREELNRRASLEQPRADGVVPLVTVELNVRFRDVGLQPNSFADRTILLVDATYVADGFGQEELRGAVNSEVGYDTRDLAFGDVVLQSDAEERAALLLADLLWQDLVQKAR